MKSKSQKAKLPTKKPAMRFYKGNRYTCEKMSFKTRKEAFEGIWEGGNDTNLRPYKCDRCECWHLTHKKERSLWEDKKANMTLKPNEIRYWLSAKHLITSPNKVRSNLFINAIPQYGVNSTFVTKFVN
jgi:hypothetical protein